MTLFSCPHTHGTDDRFYTTVRAAAFPQHMLRYRNDRAAQSVGFDLSDEDWVHHFGKFAPLNVIFQPLALCYHGHQFGV